MDKEELKINCPKCGQEIEITDAIKNQAGHFLEDALAEERKKLESELDEKAKKNYQEKLKAIEEENIQTEKELADFRSKELELRRKNIELESAKKNMEVDLARKLDAEREKLKEEASKEFEEKNRWREAEKNKKITDLQKTIDELNRKAAQGSQQTQGEVVELELENLLKSEFPQDEISPVGKGQSGADIIQTVHDRNGRKCGKIVWEIKNTKSWSVGWISKLKEDQRREKAELAVIISSVIPEEIKHFGVIENVWVSKFDYSLPLAHSLRRNLISLTNIRQSVVNRNEKMEIVYNYIVSNDFKQRVEAIAEAFVAMKDDLDKEKRVFTKVWAAREKQIGKVLDNTVGIYGDMQGLIGGALPEIKQLSLESGFDQEISEKNEADLPDNQSLF